MAALHRELDQDKEVLQCYGHVLVMCEEDGSSSLEIPASSLSAMATYILGRREESKSTWTMVRVYCCIHGNHWSYLKSICLSMATLALQLEKVFQYLPENDSKRNIRPKFVSHGLRLLKVSGAIAG